MAADVLEAEARVWSAKQKIVSNVTPRSFGRQLSGSSLLFMKIDGLKLASFVPGVIRVTVDLEVEMVSPRLERQLHKSGRYC